MFPAFLDGLPDGSVVMRHRASQVAAAVKAGGFGPREVIVRVNGLDTAWAEDDMAAVAGCGADAILFPKIAVQLSSSGWTAAARPARRSRPGYGR